LASPPFRLNSPSSFLAIIPLLRLADSGFNSLFSLKKSKRKEFLSVKKSERKINQPKDNLAPIRTHRIYSQYHEHFLYTFPPGQVCSANC
jgi:hypothetical protein